MKHNMMQRVTGFVLKYIWFFCLILIVLEFTGTIYSTKIMIQQSTVGVMQAVSGELSGRVDGVLRLLKGLAADERIANTNLELYQRAQLADTFKASYNLFMIAVTDKDVNVESSDQRTRPEKYSNLAHRDYMQRLYSTGTYQITDAFVAGADGVTMNYTIAVPIIKNGEVVGSVFGSIYFENMINILKRNASYDRRFYMLGSQNTFIASSEGNIFGQHLRDVAGKARFLGITLDEIDSNIRAGIPQNYWEWGDHGLSYVSTIRVVPTNWTLIYHVSFASVLITLLPILFMKVCFYILLCAGVSIYGRRYLHKQLGAVSHLLDKVAAIQKELFLSEQTDYNCLLEMTEKGLTDQLTGLSTRSVLFNRMQPFISRRDTTCAIFFLDLDDLKRINDTFGHEAGDFALGHFAKILKEYEQRYHGIAARYGGDEFILLLDGVDPQHIHETANELCNSLRSTIRVKGIDVPIHSSIGIALCPQHGDKAEDLISKADFALYAAKQNGKNRYALYDSDSRNTLFL